MVGSNIISSKKNVSNFLTFCDFWIFLFCAYRQTINYAWIEPDNKRYWLINKSIFNTSIVSLDPWFIHTNHIFCSDEKLIEGNFWIFQFWNNIQICTYSKKKVKTPKCINTCVSYFLLLFFFSLPLLKSNLAPSSQWPRLCKYKYNSALLFVVTKIKFF